MHSEQGAPAEGKRSLVLQTGDYSAEENSIARALTIDPANSGALQLHKRILHRRRGVN